MVDILRSVLKIIRLHNFLIFTWQNQKRMQMKLLIQLSSECTFEINFIIFTCGHKLYACQKKISKRFREVVFIEMVRKLIIKKELKKYCAEWVSRTVVLRIIHKINFFNNMIVWMFVWWNWSNIDASKEITHIQNKKKYYWDYERY